MSKLHTINKEEIKEHLHRGRFLLPNIVTVGNLFCGLLTIIYASSGRFEKACVAVLIAILLDGLDGRVARRFNATSKFGVEFDSFSDLVSFGLAPALLVYFWTFKALADEFGVFICFVYIIAAASRLARFNISAENLSNFEGCPTPAAAAMVVAVVNYDLRLQTNLVSVTLGTFIMLALAYIMVSKIEFFSIKKLKLKNTNTFTRILLGSTVALTWYKPSIALLLITSCYCLSGPYGIIKKKVFKNCATACE
jgi:CDP-diacylglycerol--serine O-phosphatidyltransferase